MSGSEYLQSTFVFGLAGLILLLPLGWLLPAATFRSNRRAIVMGASLFWPAFGFTLVQYAWTGYYQYFYSGWMMWGILPVALAIYTLYALACHWLASHLPGHPLPWFCLLVGLLAAIEHLAGWYLAHLPEKVPFLSGTPLGPVMLFAFFEYQVYWAIALWLGWLLLKLTQWRKTWQERS